MDDRIHGGVISDVLPHPRAKSSCIALRGVWSGGMWFAEANMVLNHYRDGEFYGQSKVVGVDLVGTTTHSEVVLLVEYELDQKPISEDVVIFGEGSYSLMSHIGGFDMYEHGNVGGWLSVSLDNEKYAGITELRDVGMILGKRRSKFWIFHPSDVVIEPGTHNLWRKDRCFPVILERYAGVL
jgi:hypothetical protein